MGTFPGKYKIKIHDNAVGVIKLPKRVSQTALNKLKIEFKKLKQNNMIGKSLRA